MVIPAVNETTTVVTYLDEFLTQAGAAHATLGLTPMAARQLLLTPLITGAPFATGLDARVPSSALLLTLSCTRWTRPCAALAAAPMPEWAHAHAGFGAGVIVGEFRVVANFPAGVSAGSAKITAVEIVINRCEWLRDIVSCLLFFSPFSPRQKEGLGRSQLNLHLNSKTATGAERAIAKKG